jgi:hypothetical protein
MNDKAVHSSSVKAAIRIQTLAGLVAGILVATGLGLVMFKAAKHLTASTQNEAPGSRLAEASIILGEVSAEDGLRLLNTGDGSVAPTNKDGVSCVRLKGRSEGYIYFALDPALKTSAHMNGIIHVEFLAPVSGRFDVQYDGYKFGARPESVYSDTPIGIHFDSSSTV